MPRKPSAIETGVEKLLVTLLNEATTTNAPPADGATVPEALPFADRVRLVETAGRWLTVANKLAPEEPEDNSVFGEYVTKLHGGKGARRAGPGAPKARNGARDSDGAAPPGSAAAAE